MFFSKRIDSAPESFAKFSKTAFSRTPVNNWFCLFMVFFYCQKIEFENPQLKTFVFLHKSLHYRQKRKFPSGFDLNFQKFLSVFLCFKLLRKTQLSKKTLDLCDKTHCNKACQNFIANLNFIFWKLHSLQTASKTNSKVKS